MSSFVTLSRYFGRPLEMVLGMMLCIQLILIIMSENRFDMEFIRSNDNTSIDLQNDFQYHSGIGIETDDNVHSHHFDSKENKSSLYDEGERNDNKESKNDGSSLQPTFQRYDNVAIVTKIHSPQDSYRLKKMLCFLDVAYNQYVNYDVIVFTTKPWSQNDINELQQVIPNTKLLIVIDGPSKTGDLSEYLINTSQEEIEMLKERCGETLSWENYCIEDGSMYKTSLAYNWQSEFRAYHIFKHEALKPFKYMIWMDSDALCTESWSVDPMKMMVENDLTIAFPNFPAGKTENPLLKSKIEAAYNESVCHAILNKEGFLWGKKCNGNDKVHFQHIHGFHHITNLDVYRKEKHLKFLHSITEGNYKFSRIWDDQLGVTVPAVMDTPGKAWDYWSHNVTTNIFHHGDLDGKVKVRLEGERIKDYTKWFDRRGKNWKDAQRCKKYLPRSKS